jgi:hypothetical protein
MFDFSSWTHYLCEYLFLPQCYYLKRLIKKLLQILCGSKEKYRKFKDHHMLTFNIKQIVMMADLNSAPKPQSMLTMGSTISQANNCISMVTTNAVTNLLVLDKKNFNNRQTQTITQPIKLTYLNLVKLVENLKAILDVAVSRTINWQRFCAQNASTLIYLIDLALLIGVDSNGSGIDSSSLNSAGNIAAASTSVIVPNILQLLLCALGGTKSSTHNKTMFSSANLTNISSNQV